MTITESSNPSNFLEADVRNALIHMLVENLGFPRAWLAVEKELKEFADARAPRRRIDLLAYGMVGNTLIPLLLIECKRETVDAAAEQVIGYNAFVRAPFVALACAGEMRWGYCDMQSGTYLWHSGIPSYQTLLQTLKVG